MNSRLQDDLFRDFKEQVRFIEEHVKLFDPIAESLSRPAATRILRKLWMILLEILMYACTIGTVVFAFTMHHIKPFRFIETLWDDDAVHQSVGAYNIWILHLVIYGLISIIALLFFILALNIRAMRIKNDILHRAGKNIKTVAGQLLKRKAAIDAIEQRYFTELPTLTVNDIPNPGYDGDN